MRGVKLIIPGLVLIAVVVFQSLFVVQEISQAIVLQFGDPKKIVTKAGLNFKLPFIQNVVYLDKRILNLDNDPEEVIAADQKRLIVDAFARFKIVDPLKFYISVGNERVARSRLSTIINSRIRGVLGTQELATLLSTDRADAHPNGARPFKRQNYINKFLTLTKDILSKKESDRFLKIVQNLKNLKSGQLNKLNIEVRKSKLKRNSRNGIF